MTQEIQKNSMGDLMSIAQAFAESGMFPDTKSAAQAIVKIQAGQEIGIPPFQAMTGIHIIQGKPTIGAGIIASRVKGSGKYDYRVIQQDDNVCSIDFYQGKEKIGNSTFTIQDAKRAGTKNIDRFPKNMLFARAISNGVRWYSPDIFSGPVYVPEEMEQVTEDVPHTEVLSPDKTRYSTPEEIEAVLASLTTVKEAANLYYVNTELIESTPGLKDKFSEKRNQIANPES